MKDVNIRRRVNIVLGTVLVLGLVATGIVLTLQLRDSNGGDGAAGEFDRIVTVDPERGTVRILDAAGERLDELDVAGATRLGQANGRFVTLFGSDDVWILDVDAGAVRPVDAEPEERFLWLGDERAVLAAFPAQGGDVELIDASSGDAISFAREGDIDEPMLLGDSMLADADDDVFAITDFSKRRVRTIVTGFDRETLTRPGDSVAVSGDGFATLEQNDDEPSTLRFFDLDGEIDTSFEVASDPATRALVDGETLTLLDERGRLLRASAGAAELERVGSVDLGGANIRLAIALSRDVVLVHTQDDVVIAVGADGEELVRTSGAPELRSVASRAQHGAPETGCLDVATDVGVRQFDVETGAELTRAPVEGTVLGASPDGCALVLQVPSAILINGTVVELGEREQAVDVAADGSAALVRTRDALELRHFEDPDIEPIDLGDVIGRFVSVSGG